MWARGLTLATRSAAPVNVLCTTLLGLRAAVVDVSVVGLTGRAARKTKSSAPSVQLLDCSEILEVIGCGSSHAVILNVRSNARADQMRR